MLNRTIIVGRLTRDPELKKTNTGKSIMSFSVAVPRTFNKDQTDFINCVAWEQTADFMSAYLGKGSLISVEGRIQSGSYENAKGDTVYTQDVQAERVQALESRAQRESNGTVQNMYKDEKPKLNISSDDLPF